MGTLYIIGFVTLVVIAGAARGREIRKAERASVETARLLREISKKG